MDNVKSKLENSSQRQSNQSRFATRSIEKLKRKTIKVAYNQKLIVEKDNTIIELIDKQDPLTRFEAEK